MQGSEAAGQVSVVAEKKDELEEEDDLWRRKNAEAREAEFQKELRV